MKNAYVPTDDIKPLYSPAGILNAFANSLTSPVLNEQFAIKGIYKKGKGVNYSGLYYDILKDEYTDANITLVVPEVLRHKLNEGQFIEATTYLSKRVSATTGRIDLLLNLSDVMSSKERAIDEEEVKKLQLIQQKAKAGYKDVGNLIKSKIYQQSRVSVTIIMGTTAIVDNDISHQLKGAIEVFDIKYVRVNLTRPIDIINALQSNDGRDILVITRGGGENIQVFDNLQICEQALKIKSPFITAIGHAVDDPLLQKVADKYFITPTAFGQYLYDVYIRAIEEMNNSKAKLISDLSKQIDLQYQAKLQDLNARLVETTQSIQEIKTDSNLKIQTLTEKLSKSKSVISILVTVLIILSVIIVVYLSLGKYL